MWLPPLVRCGPASSFFYSIPWKRCSLIPTKHHCIGRAGNAQSINTSLLWLRSAEEEAALRRLQAHEPAWHVIFVKEDGLTVPKRNLSVAFIAASTAVRFTCLILPCLALPCLTLPYLTLPYLTLPFLHLLHLLALLALPFSSATKSASVRQFSQLVLMLSFHYPHVGCVALNRC